MKLINKYILKQLVLGLCAGVGQHGCVDLADASLRFD